MGHSNTFVARRNATAARLRLEREATAMLRSRFHRLRLAIQRVRYGLCGAVSKACAGVGK